MPRRDETVRRRTSSRVERTSILVYCGGSRTEPLYLDGLYRALRSPAISVLIRHEGVDPTRLVRSAARYRDQWNGVFDETWCVIDVDDFDMRTTAAEARRSHVNLAVSNPCFELWLLLHHAECRSFCAGCADVMRRLRKHVQRYDKSRLKFADYANGVGKAVKRARDLDPEGVEHRHNPSTGVWRLVERMRPST